MSTDSKKPLALATGSITTEDFFTALAPCKTTATWSLDDVGALRGTGEVTCCPLTAVAHALTGQWLRPGLYGMAASAIGLPLWHADRIAQAADTPALCGGLARLRARLLTTLGVTDDDEDAR